MEVFEEDADSGVAELPKKPALVLKNLISLSAKQKADLAVYAFQYRVFSSDKDMDYYRLASKIVQGYFQKLSSAQIKSLSFYTMSEALDAMKEDLEELNEEMQKMRQAQAKLRHYMESIKKRMAELQSSKKSPRESSVLPSNG